MQERVGGGVDGSSKEGGGLGVPNTREGEVREGLAWRGNAGCAGLVDGGSGMRGKGSGGRCKGFGSGGVGGRDTGSGTEQISRCVSLRKMAVFEGCPVGVAGGVPTGAGLVDGGGQGP